uniref:Uncharacterized protein n=1 Tax=Octopus bimaculoides TaxID=37653 RepID=A0A0L8FIA3_OCTBM
MVVGIIVIKGFGAFYTHPDYFHTLVPSPGCFHQCRGTAISVHHSHPHFIEFSGE